MNVVFIFDRVCHYHKPLFISLSKKNTDQKNNFILLSGQPTFADSGRVGLATKVIDNEFNYLFREFKLSSFTIRHQSGIVNLLKKIKPDIVISPSHVGNITIWALMRLKKTLGFKLVAWQCGYEFNPSKIKDFILSRFIRGFDYHLAYHTNAAKYAIKYGAKENQVTIVHNTIDESLISICPKSEAKNQIEMKYPVVKGKKILLFVGAILKEKRLDLVLDAVDQLKRDDYIFMIVGDGQHMPVLKDLCLNRKNIILTGSIVDGVGVYFDAADIFILPGTGGLAINEAMAHSLPIISGYADGSADDLVIHRSNGYRIGDSALEIVNYLTELFDNDDLREKMGLKSRDMITSKFSFINFIERVNTSLNSL